MPTKEPISNPKTKTEETITIDQLGRFKIFKFTHELMSEQITEAMQKESAKPCDTEDLNTFNEAFLWRKGQLVALGGKFYGGGGCYVPLLKNGKVSHLENLYGDRGKWDSAFYFLAK